VTTSPPSAAPVVRLDGVTRRFESRAETVTAVRDVTLALHAGELVALAGPSGSGKTTALNLILGWEEPDDGRVERTFDLAAGWAAQAVVPQDLGLLDELTVVENVALAARLSGAASRPLADLLAAVDLEHLAARRPAELSMGEKQRCAVARAATCSPIVLAADEPTAHQDERHADMVMALLATVAGDGSAVLIVTHDIRLLAAVDRVVDLVDGSVIPR
jgi:putative ABC transport system ATP-binding protein